MKLIDCEQIKFHVKPNYYILMSVSDWNISIRSHSFAVLFARRVECVANIAINENLCFFISAEMNFPLSQFHVLWIFIIHLCSTISHLSIHVEHGWRYQSIQSILLLNDPCSTATKKNDSIRTRKFNQMQFVGICFSFNIFFYSFHWISHGKFPIKMLDDVGRQRKNSEPYFAG